MIGRLTFAPLLVAIALLSVGCGVGSQSVGVVARNDTPEPIVAWLTKSGPPVEDNWLSPGQIAAYYATSDADNDLSQLPGILVQPGETIRIPPRRGRFPGGTVPQLQVYHGQSDLVALAATNLRGPNADVVRLMPGENFVIVRSVNPVNAEPVPPSAFGMGRSDGR